MPNSSIAAAAAAAALTAEDGNEVAAAWLEAHLMPLQATQAWREEALRLLLGHLSHDRDLASRLNCSLWQDLLKLQIDGTHEKFEAYLKKHRELLGIGIPRIDGDRTHDGAPGVGGDGPGCEKPDELRPVEPKRAEAAAPTEEKQPAL